MSPPTSILASISLLALLEPGTLLLGEEILYPGASALTLRTGQDETFGTISPSAPADGIRSELYDVSVTKLPPKRAHDICVSTNTVSSIEEGDILSCSYSFRGQQGTENVLTSSFQTAHVRGETGDRHMTLNPSCSTDWLRQLALFAAKRDLEPRKGRFIASFGGAVQTLEFGAVSIRNFGPGRVLTPRGQPNVRKNTSRVKTMSVDHHFFGAEFGICRNLGRGAAHNPIDRYAIEVKEGSPSPGSIGLRFQFVDWVPTGSEVLVTFVARSEDPDASGRVYVEASCSEEHVAIEVPPTPIWNDFSARIPVTGEQGRNGWHVTLGVGAKPQELIIDGIGIALLDAPSP